MRALATGGVREERTWCADGPVREGDRGLSKALRYVGKGHQLTRPCSRPLSEVEMQPFVHNENIVLYHKLIAESERNPARDEKRHAMLLTLLAEEKAKEKPLDG